MFVTQHYGEFYGNLPTITSKCSQQQDRLHIVGELAPDFQLPTTDGRMLNLSDFQGSRVIVAFVTPWGRLCRSQLPALAHFATESGVMVLTICSGEASSIVEEFVTEHDFPFPVLHDADSAVKRQYQVTCLPMNFCIDEEGRIADFHRGEVDETILSHWMANISPVGAIK